MKKCGSWIISMCLIMTCGYAQEIPTLTLGLNQAEEMGVNYSQTLKSKQLALAASQAKAKSQFSVFWPQLSIDGSYQVASEVGHLELNLPLVGSQEISFGDHTSYMLGATAVWNIWNSGSVYHQWQAQQQAVMAKRLEVALAKQQVLIEVRLAYFQTQLALEQESLLKQSLELAKSQHQDIKAKQAAGMTSQVDVLSSHLEVLGRVKQLKRIQVELANTIRTLLNVTGVVEQYNLSSPAAADHSQDHSSSNRQPSMLIKLDELDQSLTAMDSAKKQSLDEEHPGVQLYRQLAVMISHVSSSIHGNHWPKVQVSGKTGWEYPNGPLTESVYQNRAGIKAHWPIFKGFQVVNLEKEQDLLAKGYQQEAERAKLDLTLQWHGLHDQLKMLQAEEQLMDQAVKETKQLAQLSYQAYLAGRLSYIQVQQANLRILEAQTNYIKARIEQLIQLALLDNLADKKVRGK